MSTIIVAAIVIAIIVAICFFLINIHNKHRRESMNNLLKHFSHLGTENNLSFSSQEVLKNSILGLDGVRRKVLVVTNEDDFFNSFIIDLNLLTNCNVKKVYGSRNVGGLKTRKFEKYLEKIVLHFDLKGELPAEIVFYKHFSNYVYEIPELEQKAKDWETILSKMQTPAKNIA